MTQTNPAVVLAFCSGHFHVAPVDDNWRALWIEPSTGRMVLDWPEKSGDLDFERPDTVFACGQGCALRLTERYLHHRSFFLNPQLPPAGPADAFAELT